LRGRGSEKKRDKYQRRIYSPGLYHNGEGILRPSPAFVNLAGLARLAPHLWNERSES
jgi:hypothetical protein